jgi:hypothetical protein
MSYPTYKTDGSGHTNGDPILIVDGVVPDEFPINYRRYGDDIQSGLTYANKEGDEEEIKRNTIDIDVQKAFENSYIKIKLKYDADNNQYIWYIVNEDGVTPDSIVKENGELSVIMWEPRLNGIMQEENIGAKNNE